MKLTRTFEKGQGYGRRFKADEDGMEVSAYITVKTGAALLEFQCQSIGG